MRAKEVIALLAKELTTAEVLAVLTSVQMLIEMGGVACMRAKIDGGTKIAVAAHGMITIVIKQISETGTVDDQLIRDIESLADIARTMGVGPSGGGVA